MKAFGSNFYNLAFRKKPSYASAQLCTPTSCMLTFRWMGSRLLTYAKCLSRVDLGRCFHLHKKKKIEQEVQSPLKITFLKAWFGRAVLQQVSF